MSTLVEQKIEIILEHLCTMDKPTLGGLIRDARVAAGLSQYALGQRAGVSGQAVEYIESGARAPYFATVVRLARVLGLDYAALAECIPENTPVEPRPVGRPRKSPRPEQVEPKRKRGRPRKEQTE